MDRVVELAGRVGVVGVAELFAVAADAGVVHDVVGRRAGGGRCVVAGAARQFDLVVAVGGFAGQQGGFDRRRPGGERCGEEAGDQGVDDDECRPADPGRGEERRQGFDVRHQSLNQ